MRTAREDAQHVGEHHRAFLEEISRAKVDLKGNLGRGSPIDIKGTINPLAKDRYVDMNVSFKDIELSPATPYAIRYLGYTIEKGKLTFDVKYLIEGNKLTAQNKFFFDQLTFGEKVESPDAIKLPVTTAVSLLKDRNGQINLDVPLSGSLDDPKFSVWPIIWQVIVNLITKAVTAPFALLGSLFGEAKSSVTWNLIPEARHHGGRREEIERPRQGPRRKTRPQNGYRGLRRSGKRR